ncbi:MAG: hypothetical protein AAF035_11320 [Pseudomonadota bacterium]
MIKRTFNILFWIIFIAFNAWMATRAWGTYGAINDISVAVDTAMNLDQTPSESTPNVPTATYVMAYSVLGFVWFTGAMSLAFVIFLTRPKRPNSIMISNPNDRIEPRF